MEPRSATIVPTCSAKKHKLSIDIYDASAHAFTDEAKLVRSGVAAPATADAVARPKPDRGPSETSRLCLAVADVVSCIAGRCGAWKMDGVAFAP